MSKIVVVTGSPRKNGNTDAMVRAFVEAAEAKGHEVVRFDAANANVGGCRACDTCYKTGKPCSFDDDFNAVAPELLAADGIVIAAPLYWYTFPGKIKNVIDKMYSFCVGKKDMAGKKAALIACCEEGDSAVFAGMTGPLALSAKLLGWEMVGEVLVPGVFEAGAIERTDGCARAAALAEKF